MSQERNEAHEIGHCRAAYPMKGCRKRLAYHDHERYGRYRDIKLADAGRVLDMTLSPDGIPARKTYVTCPNGKHSRWVVALDGLRMLKDRHPSLVGKSKISALIEWAIRNGISETLWPESTLPVAITPQPTVEVVAEEPAVPVEMPKWDGKGSPFDAIREFDEQGREFWSARRLMDPLGYKQWRDFEFPIDKAKQAFASLGLGVDENFASIRKVSGSRGPQAADYRLSRRACYLVAQNCDSHKPEVAAAMHYFAIRTHQAEQAETKPDTGDFASILECFRAIAAINQNHANAIAGLDSRTAELQKDMEATRVRSAKALELAEHVQDRMNGLTGPFTVNEWCQKHGYRLTTREKQLIGTFLSYEAKRRNATKKDSCVVTPIYGVASYKINAYPMELLREFDRYFADYKKHEHEWIGVARTVEAARRKRQEEEERGVNPSQQKLF